MTTTEQLTADRASQRPAGPAAEAYADRVRMAATFRDRHGSFPLVTAENPVEKRLAIWLLGQRMGSALGRMAEWKRDVLDSLLAGWDTAVVADWYGRVQRLAAAGLDTTDPELVSFLAANRRRFFDEKPNDDGYVWAILDQAVPGWEEGPGFSAWMEREALYCREVMDAGREYGRDMIHDHYRFDRRLTVFFDRLQVRHKTGRVGEDELAWLCSLFETLSAYLHID